MILTSSSIGTLQSCKMKYKLRYIDRLEPVTKPGYFALGSAFHRAVEVMRRGGTLSDMLLTCSENSSLSSDDDCVLTAMVEAYHRRHLGGGVRAAIAPAFTHVEHQWLYQASPGLTIAGVVDAIDEHGYIHETKTTSRLDEKYKERLWSARQTLMYVSFLRRLGFDIKGVIYDIIQKPTIKRLLATPHEKRKFVKDKVTKEMRLSATQRERDETDAEYLTRLRAWYREHPGMLHQEEIVYTERQLEDIFDDVLREGKELMERRWFTRSRDACYPRGGSPCPFKPLCDNDDNPVLRGTHYQVREKTHSELDLN
jgi:hypothetical protein